MSDGKKPISKDCRRENRIGTQPSLLGPKATDDQVSMRDIVPQRLDRRGTRVEDIAGTGEHDSLGG